MKTIPQNYHPALRALAALVFIFLIGACINANGAFFKFETHVDMLRHISRFGVLACGMTLVIITGGVDLAVGSVLGLSAVCFAWFSIHLGLPGWVSIPLCLLVGSATGLVSGTLVAKFKIQSFVATLAMMVFARGLAKMVSGGQKISTAVQGPDGSYSYQDPPEVFHALTAQLLGGNLFVASLLFFLCVALLWVVLNRLRIGRHLYAIGGNEESARLSGIPVDRSKIIAYVISGGLAALAGICHAADEIQGDPEAGQTYELTAIAIVVIGGTSLMGGRGGILLTLLGTLTIGYLEKILSINAIGDAHRLIITGVIIVCAVLFQRSESGSGLQRKPWLRNRLVWAGGGVLLLVLGIGLVRTKTPIATESLGTITQQTYVIGMSQSNLGEPWRVQMNEDIRQAAAEHPYLQVIFKDAQNDSLRQKAQIEEFISAGVDLLIVTPKEAAPLTPPIEKAYDRGIPVVILDRKILGNKYTTYISGDNERIGYAAGTWIRENFPSGTRIVELKGLMTSTPAQERHQGFRDAIEGAGFEIVFEADMKWLEPSARQEMASALARFDHIDLVYAHNDPAAHGAFLAAKAVGREKAIVFVGIDALSQEGQVYVKQGILQASFEYPTGGDVAIETALKILAGETVPKEIILDSRKFTQSE